MLGKRYAFAALGLASSLAASQAQAQSASSEQEIALLKQQLKMLEQKLDKLQSQTAANAVATAKARARAEAKAEAKADARPAAKAAAANANAAIPVKGPAPASGIVATMPNNRPTICTADGTNCVAITSRVHWDVGGYDYRPNTAATVPQKLDSGENVRRARASASPASSSTTGFLRWSTTSAARPAVLAARHLDHCPAAASPVSRMLISATPA